MKCSYCKKEFDRITVSTTCSLKCRLLDKVKINGECWEWQGTLLKNGYGKLRYQTKFLSVHRVSYELFVGPIPIGMYVCHNCPGGDNKKCVNPKHLWIGTYKENSTDAKNKGLYIGKGSTGKKLTQETKDKISLNHADLRGQKSPRSKLKDIDIYEIRELLKTEMTLKDIGLKYGVSKHAISNIKNKKTWSHI